MFQQIIAIIIIIFFISRLFWQKKKNLISKNEFIFWMIFWCVAILAILSLKWLDKISNELGFSASGVDILIYISIIILFYLIFKIRLQLAKNEKAITKIIREISLKEKN